jgi:hypothetical protein
MSRSFVTGPANGFGSAGCARDRLSTGPLAIDFVDHHFPLEGVAMDAEQLSRLGLIGVGHEERAFDHAPLQDLDGLFHKKAGGHQIVDQGVKTFFHEYC